MADISLAFLGEFLLIKSSIAAVFYHIGFANNVQIWIQNP